jgi:hypothetical protein
MTLMIALVIALAVVVLVLVIVSRSRGASDGVDSFRRQIDALSPEARRPVIDQMYGKGEHSEPRIDPRIDPRPADADNSDARGESSDDDASDQDGAHGT